MGIDAIFLALDDVLFDTEAAHLAACNDAFAAAGLAARWTSPALRKAARAHGYARVVAAVFEGLDSRDRDVMVAELAASKHRFFHESVLVNPPATYPACQQLIHDALHAGSKLAIVTDMPAPTAAALLEQCFGHEVNSTFAVVSTGVDFSSPADNGPHALALRTMGVEARASIAIDVASPALGAAQAAGIWTVSVTPYEKDVARMSGADLWCPQLQELRHMVPVRRSAAERRDEFVTFKTLRALKAGAVLASRG